MRSLSRGMQGPDVLAVQQALNRQRQPGEAALAEDSAFGPNTDAAVRRFQTRARIQVDGIVGPQTRAKLFPLAVATIRALGMRLLRPGSLGFGDRSGSAPQLGGFGPLIPPLGPGLPPPSQPPLPSLNFTGFQPIRYPNMTDPIVSPLAPPDPPALGLQLRLPVHHFELSPGSQISFGRDTDVAFGLTINAVVMIGDEDAPRHQEFSSGISTSTPGLFQGGDWTVTWFFQLTHVEQLGRSGNFSWQPNGQVGFTPGFNPLISASVTPLALSWDATKFLSFQIGAGAVVSYSPINSRFVVGGTASAGVVFKFDGPTGR